MTMKNTITSGLLSPIILMVLLSSCNMGFELVEPNVNLNVSGQSVAVGEEIIFTATGGADLYSIYTGDKYEEDGELVNHRFDESAYFLIPPDAFDYIDIAAGDTIIDVRYEEQRAVDTLLFIGPLRLRKIDVTDYRMKGEGGVPIPFSTGFAMPREAEGQERSFSYSYSRPGVYRVTLLVTNVGRKQYEGDGYRTGRGNEISFSEYETKTQIVETTITVN